MQINLALPFTTADVGGVEKSRIRILTIEEVESVLKNIKRELKPVYERELSSRCSIALPRGV